MQNNLCTPKNGEILVASTQDFLTSSFLITRKDTFYDRAAFSLLCSYMGDGMDHVDLPTPAVIKVRHKSLIFGYCYIIVIHLPIYKFDFHSHDYCKMFKVSMLVRQLMLVIFITINSLRQIIFFSPNNQMQTFNKRFFHKMCIEGNFFGCNIDLDIEIVSKRPYALLTCTLGHVLWTWFTKTLRVDIIFNLPIFS